MSQTLDWLGRGRRHVDKLVWVALGALLLYRFVIPHGSAPVSAALAGAAVSEPGQPLFLEFSSTH